MISFILVSDGWFDICSGYEAGLKFVVNIYLLMDL